MHDEGATLQGVIDFRGMETQRGHVACIQYALAIYLHAKGMGGIVDNLQTILVCNLLYLLHLHRLAIAVYGHDGRGLGGDGGLNLIRIDTAGVFLNIHKYGFAAVPPDAVGGGHEAVRCGDDLACDAQGLQCRQQGQCSVSKQTDIRHFQILCKCFFQLLMEAAIVGNPLACPDLLQHGVEFFKIWQ